MPTLTRRSKRRSPHGSKRRSPRGSKRRSPRGSKRAVNWRGRVRMGRDRRGRRYGSALVGGHLNDESASDEGASGEGALVGGHLNDESESDEGASDEGASGEGASGEGASDDIGTLIENLTVTEKDRVTWELADELKSELKLFDGDLEKFLSMVIRALIWSIPEDPLNDLNHIFGNKTVTKMLTGITSVDTLLTERKDWDTFFKKELKEEFEDTEEVIKKILSFFYRAPDVLRDSIWSFSNEADYHDDTTKVRNLDEILEALMVHLDGIHEAPKTGTPMVRHRRRLLTSPPTQLGTP